MIFLTPKYFLLSLVFVFKIIVFQFILGTMLNPAIILGYGIVYSGVMSTLYWSKLLKYDVYLAKNYPLKHRERTDIKSEFLDKKFFWFTIWYEISKEIQDNYNENMDIDDLAPYIRQIKFWRNSTLVFIPIHATFPFFNIILCTVWNIARAYYAG